MASGNADAFINVRVRVNNFERFTTNKTKQDVLISTTCAPNNLGGIFMTKIISQQDLLKKIVSISQEIFEQTLDSNPNGFSYDDEKHDRKFHLNTQEMRCSFHRYEHPHEEPYYAMWFDLFFDTNPGFDIGRLVIHNAFGKANFYIDDGDYGRVNDYNEEKVNSCFSVIYNVLSELTN